MIFIENLEYQKCKIRIVRHERTLKYKVCVTVAADKAAFQRVKVPSYQLPDSGM